MSRFSDDYDGDGFQNQWEFWNSNVMRALGGKKGQAALRELESILVSMPEKRIIEGALATKGEVCTVGAIILHRRVEAGESREAVLADMEHAIPAECGSCWHTANDHRENGSCSRCDRCSGFVDSGYANCDGALITMEEGKKVGLTYTLACHLGYLNDEDGSRKETPEERYERVLRWTRRVIQPETVAV